MRILITGCHGFIGSSVGHIAAQIGHVVIGVGLASQPEPGWPGCYHQADVVHSDFATIIERHNPDVILHAAGTASVGASFTAPLDDLRAAVMSLANVLDGVRRSGQKPLVLFPSSAAVYGEPRMLPIREDAPVAPISPYGYHKAAAELFAREYCHCFGFDIVIARLFSVYGPRQRRLLVWELYCEATGTGSEVVLRGTGEETRDYLHVDDVATVLLTIATRRPRGLTVLNVASGAATRTRDVAQLIVGAAEVTKLIRALSQPQTGNPQYWQASVESLQGIEPFRFRPLKDGITECVRAWRCA